MIQRGRAEGAIHRLEPKVAIGAAALIGVVVAGLGQLVPPLNLPTHEFVQALTAGIFLGLPLLRIAGDRHTALVATLASGVALAGAAWVVQWTTNSLIWGCRAEDAVAFYWVTVLPVIGVAAVLGVLTRSWRTRWRVGLVVGLAALGGAHDGLQFLNGVRVVDPILGDPLAFNQRIGMAVPSLHTWQRLWLVAVSCAVWFTAAATRTGRKTAAVLAVGAALAMTGGAGSHIGVGWSRHALRSHLDSEHHTEHFTILYNGTGRAASRVDGVARDLEWHYHRLTEAWGVRPRRRVEVRLFDGYDDLGRLTGRAWPHAGFYQIDIPLRRTTTTTLPHELVHALHAELAYNPRLIWHRGMAEGAAVAFSEGLTETPEAHKRQAGALLAGHLPPADAFMSDLGFHAVNEGNAYDAAGSFLGYLVLEHGVDKFVALQKRFDWRGIYGEDLAGLDARWRAFLQQVPLDLSDRARARDDFDPDTRPSYLDRECPKLGSRGESARDRAERVYADGDYLASASAFEDLARGGKLRWVTRAAISLERLGRPAEADALLSEHLAHDLDDDQRYKLLDRQLHARLALQDWGGVIHTLDALRILGPTRRLDRLESCLRDPELRGPVGAYVLRRNAAARADLLTLLANHPDHDGLVNFVTAYGGWLPDPGRALGFSTSDRAEIGIALGLLDRAPAACVDLSTDLLALVDKAVRIREFALAEALLIPLARCDDVAVRTEAGERRARLTWER